MPDLPSPRIAFEPNFLRRLERFVARASAAGERREGSGGARLAGDGEEFVGYRPYRPGEDLRRLDWDLFARLDRPFVRVSRREAREDWTLLIDTSASMGVGTPGKLQAAAELATALGAIGLGEGAHVRFVLSGAARPFELRRRGQLGEWLALLESVRAEGEAGLAALLEPTRVRRAGKVFAVGDFFDVEPAALLSLACRGRRLFAAQVLAPEELAPAADGPVVWVDAERGDRRALVVDRRARREYEARLDARLEAWRLACARHRAAYWCGSSATPFEDSARELLQQ